MLFSHHSHSGQFCDHAENTLEEMVQAAIKHEFRVFALTEHAPRDRVEDLYPGEVRTAAELFEIFDAFYSEAIRLRQKYADRINLLIGFETDWIRSSSKDLIDGLLARHHFQIHVGSVHHVHTIPIDFDRALYEKAREKSGGSDEGLFERYYDDQYEMLTELKPPVVGHFDLIRLKSDNPNGSFQPFMGVWGKIQRNLSFIASYGGLLELNSASLRKGMDEPYPKLEICEEFAKHRGRFTLSDDSHGVSQVAFRFLDVLKFADSAGIEELYLYDTAEEASEEELPKVIIRSVSTRGLLASSSL